MSYRPHTLITLSGTLSDTPETTDIWSIGVRGFNPVSGGDTPVDQGQLGNMLGAMNADLTAWFGSVNANIPSTTLLRQLKAANIGADGKYTGAPAIANVNQAGNAGTQNLPNFCSVAYTFTTDQPGRRAKYGRVYPPNTSNGLLQGNVISPAQATNSLNAALAFLTALNKSGAQWTFKPAVVSKLGPFAYITGCSVDRVIDVQRRRKNAVSSYGRVKSAFPAS